MIVYNKLVRDRIPDVIAADGKQCEIHVLEESAYVEALYQKLREESTEFEQDREVGELADLLEVIYAIASQQGINNEELEAMRLRKRQERGGFENRLLLVKVFESSEGYH